MINKKLGERCNPESIGFIYAITKQVHGKLHHKVWVASRLSDMSRPPAMDVIRIAINRYMKDYEFQK